MVEKRRFKKRDWVYIILFLLLFPISICALIVSLSEVRIDEMVYSKAHLLTIISVLVTVVGLVITVYFVVLAISAHRVQKEIEETQKKYYDLDKQKGYLETELRSFDEKKNTFRADLDALIAQAKTVKEEIDSLCTQKKELTNQVSDIQNILKQQKIDSNGLVNSLEQTKNNMENYSKNRYDDLNIQLALAAQSKSKSLRDNLTKKRARLAYDSLLDIPTRIKLLLELSDIGQEEDVDRIQNSIVDNEKERNEIKDIAKLALKGLKEKLRITS